MRTSQPINARRLARLIVWAQAMIVWAAAAMLGDWRPHRRHIRRRYGALSLTKLTHLVRNLLIARVAQLVRRRRPPLPWRDFSQPGFRRQRRRTALRAIGGSRLRRFMSEGSLAQRLARLVQIVRNLDYYTRAFLLRRANNGVNRLTPLLPVRPPHDSARTLATPTPLPADSS
jgi:hypothetical protein